MKLLITKKEVAKKEVEEQVFYYVNFGSGLHYRIEKRIWVSSKLIKNEDNKEFITFPLHAQIIISPKGNLIIKPSDEYCLYYIYVDCGYRGGSSFQILSPKDYVCYDFEYYASPRGNLGISKAGLICIKKDEKLKIKWERSGRLYGAPPEGISILYPDGREEVIENIADGEAIEELKNEIL